MSRIKTELNNLGIRIRQERKKKGFTQEHLAEILNVSRAAVARWELGEIEPKLSNLIGISRLFNVSVDYLLGIRDIEAIDSRLNLSAEAEYALKRFIDEIRKEMKR